MTTKHVQGARWPPEVFRLNIFGGVARQILLQYVRAVPFTGSVWVQSYAARAGESWSQLPSGEELKRLRRWTLFRSAPLNLSSEN